MEGMLPACLRKLTLLLVQTIRQCALAVTQGMLAAYLHRNVIQILQHHSYSISASLRKG